MIIEKIDEMYRENNENKYDGIHASAIGKCERELYYDAFLREKKFEPRIMRIFENGDSFHRRMIRTLYRLKDIRLVSSEISISNNDLVKGTCDAIISMNNENYIVDFKSINDFGFKVLDKPKEEHKMQILIYCYFFNIKKGIIIYENKDTQELKEFIIDYDEKYVKLLLDKIKFINECIKNKILPSKPEFREDERWKCNYCRYRKYCEENVNVDKLNKTGG